MYYLKTEQSFDSAHFLHGYHGKCANIHGHRWKVVTTIKSEKLLNDPQNMSMIIDFGDLKADLKVITDSLDHALIIEDGSLSKGLYQALIEDNFKVINFPFRPTAENLAKYIFDILNKKYDVDCVDVYETPNNCASYRG
ncbi:6-carboxytetrahydropterin synthase QueD [Thomasclavelia sp.]